MNFLLPKISDNEDAGRLTSIPGIVDAEPMNPIQSVGVLSASAKGPNPGFLDRVELNIAKNPIKHIVVNIAVCDVLLIGIF